MNKFVTILLLTVAVCMGVCISFAQEGEGDAEMAAMMEKMAALTAPGPMHKLFAEWAGDYDVTIKSWMQPGAPPEESKGTCTFRTIFGGRYMIQDYRGDFSGMAFEGMGITAYDNTREEYINLWIDNFNTTVMISRGQPDSTGKVLTWHGKVDDLMTGEKDVPIREVATLVDADSHNYDMYRTMPDGSEMKVMEITYTRKKM